MPACGEAKDADAFCVEAELAGAVADGADGAGDVQKRARPAVTRGQAIRQHEGADAGLIEPAGNRLALMRGEVAIPAAGTDDDRRAVRLVRPAELERRNVSPLIADRAGGFARPEA